MTSDLVVPPEPMTAAHFARAMRLTGPVAAKSAIAAGRPPADAIAGAFVQHAGAASRLVLNAGRDTVTRTAIRDGAGWQRVASPGACDFCQMLADRGAVYREATVHFRSHNFCTCAAEPVYSGGGRG